MGKQKDAKGLSEATQASQSQTETIEQQLAELKGQLPKPRVLTREGKLELIKQIGGPRTVRQILKAMATLPVQRIPFLFSSLDTQLVIDVMANEWEGLL